MCTCAYLIIGFRVTFFSSHRSGVSGTVLSLIVLQLVKKWSNESPVWCLDVCSNVVWSLLFEMLVFLWMGFRFFVVFLSDSDSDMLKEFFFS